MSDVKVQLAAVNSAVSSMKEQLDILRQENVARKDENLALHEENVKLTTKVLALENKIQDLDQYSRRDNIEIVGVPFSPKEDVYSIIGCISKIIGVSYSLSDVSVAHRLPDKKNTGKPNIIVKFVNLWNRDDWINAAKKISRLTAAELCNSWPSLKIYINDHLTFTNKGLLAHLRGLLREKKIASAWSRDCKVLMRVSADGRVHHVKSIEDIEKALAG